MKRRLCSLLFFDCTEHFIIIYSCIIIIHQGVYNNECDCRTQIIIIIIIILHEVISFLHTSMTQKSSGPIPAKMTRDIIIVCSSVHIYIPRYTIMASSGRNTVPIYSRKWRVFLFYCQVFRVECVRRADRFVPNNILPIIERVCQFFGKHTENITLYYVCISTSWRRSLRVITTLRINRGLR